MNVHVLSRLDSNKIIDTDKNEIRLFCLVRNEILRIPFLLEHYKKLGIERFFFIDNSSNDGTREYLLKQTNCHLFFSSNSYKSGAGIQWLNSLLNAFGCGFWCLIVDADEFLNYPYCEKITLPALCQYFDAEQIEGLFTFLLDMYPSGALQDAKPTKRQMLHHICDYFDRDYYFLKRIRLLGPEPFPPLEVLGGPRARCFYGWQGEKSFAWRLFIHILERGIVLLRKKGLNVPIIRLKSTALFKIPLVKWKHGLSFSSSTHILQPIKLAFETGVLLHYKFLYDFHDRVIKNVKDGMHTEGSIEYKKYLSHIKNIKNLMYSGSTKYESSDDVLDAGLMKGSKTLLKLATKI